MSHHDALYKIHHAIDTQQTRLDLTSMNLSYIPAEIGQLIHLETLDLSGNCLHSLPDELKNLPRLRRLFLTKNKFDTWPEIIGELPALKMFSLKSNTIRHIPDVDYLPSQLNWLILTDNKIECLPENFGFALPHLRKLALAGNRIQALPESFSNLQELELLRLSNNCLVRVPLEISLLSKLTWVSLAGNPYHEQSVTTNKARTELANMNLDFTEYVLEDVLGSGASGVVYKTKKIKQTESQFAVKVFNEVSGDGKPEDELAVSAIAASGTDLPAGLIPFRGWFDRPNFGLLMDFLNQSVSLGNPPSLESITRDVYPENFSLTKAELMGIVLTMAKVQAHLATKKIVHGDFYAHNILLTADSRPCLGDWGASFFYEENETYFEKIEVRAFGCLMEELLNRTPPEIDTRLLELVKKCLLPNLEDRPSFKTIVQELA